MKLSLSKFRYVLFGLLAVQWVSFLIYQIYIFGIFKFFRLDVLTVLLAILASVLIAFKKRWTDVFSFIIFAFYLIKLIDGFTSYCQDQNLIIVKICIKTVALKLPEVWYWFDFTWLMLSIITIIFLPFSIFKKKDLEFK